MCYYGFSAIFLSLDKNVLIGDFLKSVTELAQRIQSIRTDISSDIVLSVIKEHEYQSNAFEQDYKDTIFLHNRCIPHVPLLIVTERLGEASD